MCVNVSVDNTVISTIIEYFQNENQIQKGVEMFERYKPNLSPEQAEVISSAYDAAQAEHSDPLRFFQTW